MNFKKFLNENSFDDVKKTWLRNVYKPHFFSDRDKQIYNERYTKTEEYIDKLLLKFKEMKKYINEPEKKDIGYWVEYGYANLYNFLDNLEYDIKEKKLDKSKGKNVTKIFENNKALVVLPNTLEASCKYGAGTKWCTTSKPDEKKGERNMFKSYHLNNNIYYIIIKNSTQKYAFTVDRKTNILWMVHDEKDNLLYDKNWKEGPQLKDIVKILDKFNIPKNEIFKE